MDHVKRCFPLTLLILMLFANAVVLLITGCAALNPPSGFPGRIVYRLSGIHITHMLPTMFHFLL